MKLRRIRASLWPENWSIRQKMDLSGLNVLFVIGLSQLGIFFLAPLIRKSESVSANLTATAIMNLLFILSVIVIYGLRKTIYDLLPRKNEIAHDLTVGLKWGLIIFTVTMLMGITVNYLMHQLGVETTPQNFVQELEAVQSSKAIWIAVFVAVIAAPLGEEFIFRGVIHRTLVARVHPGLAVVISGLIFALFHGDWYQIIQLWVGGMGFAIVYHKSHSLLGAIVAHMVLNSIPLILMFGLSATL